jgi:hypothetical protein
LTVSLFIGTSESVSTQTIATFVGAHQEPEVKKPAGPIIELTPLNRSETILYNQLLAHAWNNIKTNPVHKVLKASLRGSHDSNDRLHEAFDRLMSAWAKIRTAIRRLAKWRRSASICWAPTRRRTKTTGISTTPSRQTSWP